MKTIEKLEIYELDVVAKSLRTRGNYQMVKLGDMNWCTFCWCWWQTCAGMRVFESVDGRR